MKRENVMKLRFVCKVRSDYLGAGGGCNDVLDAYLEEGKAKQQQSHLAGFYIPCIYTTIYLVITKYIIL